MWKLIRLNFGRSPVHFGETGIGIEEASERVRSDTLFSALISNYARLFGKDKVEDLLKDFQTSPPFRHSSTFIYRYQEGKYIYYLPKPLVFPQGYDVENDLEFTKTYKKLTYLPLEVWQRWYQGEGFTTGDRDELIAETKKKAKKSDALQKAGTFAYGKVYKKHKLPKVAIDRNTRATNFYHTGFVQFEYEANRHSGLYFLLKFTHSNPELENEIQATLHFLGEEGLGGERSSGAGRFDVKWLDLPQEWENIIGFSQANSYSLISLFWELPLAANLFNNRGELHQSTVYEIKERGGWLASFSSGYQLRRKMVRMFSEGSVFPVSPQGQLADVTPEKYKLHRIYRSGISLSLPLCIPNLNQS
ncbi:MAG: type III-A CRISPR-associated RAMP protein Csm4 [Oscillatoria sp. PMC 1051.18]|nr:type III-A CRISPR-associated RAMP protein Csm4 [Oscillatoria sp. PMC 1050.18]MEC5031535.1 type III-A CRISPR-associated RAMP protein Csm4 [Oscillatoria sp. PMC 1051.18]